MKSPLDSAPPRALCPVARCDDTLPATEHGTALFCERHWRIVPRPLRDQYLDALADAQQIQDREIRLMMLRPVVESMAESIVAYERSAFERKTKR